MDDLRSKAMADETTKAATEALLLIPASLILRVAEYLTYRPYREVFELIGELQQRSSAHQCPVVVHEETPPTV